MVVSKSILGPWDLKRDSDKVSIERLRPHSSSSGNDTVFHV
jgi:hypothetical protein